MKNITKISIGMMFLILGSILLLMNLGIINNISFSEKFNLFWPMGIIIAGILFINKQKGLGSLFLIVSLLIAILIPLTKEIPKGDFENEFNLEFNDEENLKINFDFGAANFKLNSTNASLISMKTHSNIERDYNFESKINNDLTIVDIFEEPEFSIQNIFQIKNIHSDINLLIQENTQTKLNLDYGAVESTMDLRKLNIKELNINSGATSSTIYFGTNPIDVEIDTGASEFNFYFEEDIGIEIKIDGGLLDSNFKDFKKIRDTYYSKNYNSSNKNIKINIDAGASSINGEFIKK